MKGLVDISILMLEEIVIPLDQNFDTSSIMYYLILNVHLSLNFHICFRGFSSLLYLLHRDFPILYCCTDCKNVIRNYFCQELWLFWTSIEFFPQGSASFRNFFLLLENHFFTKLGCISLFLHLSSKRLQSKLSQHLPFAKRSL